jgi:hypothetical protein
MSEHKSKPATSDETSKVEQKQTATTKPDAAYNKLVGEMLFLDNEDDKLFDDLHKAVTAELKPQTLLDKLEVRDFVIKLYEEQRYRNASVHLIDGARHAVTMYSDENEREFDAILQYLPHLPKFQRMIDNNEASRRSILKEVRRKAAATKGTSPPTPKSQNDN